MAGVLTKAKGVFLNEHPCVEDVIFSFGSSATLAAQIVNGSPADIFIAASQGTMDTVTRAGLTVSSPVLFARNKAAIMVAPQSRFASSIEELADLLDAELPGVKVGLCVASAPCGSLANTVLSNGAKAYGDARLSRATMADTEASSVEDLVTKIQLGELDAGITYVSDCVTARKENLATCAPIPDSVAGQPVNSSNANFVAQLTDSRKAVDWMRFMRSSWMVTSLVSDFGFGTP